MKKFIVAIIIFIASLANAAAGLAGNVFDVGWSPYGIAGVQGNGYIGAFPMYDLPEIAGTLDSDTVYGTTGTATEGGRYRARYAPK